MTLLLLDIFYPYLLDLFQPDPQFTQIMPNRIRVSGSNPNSEQGFRFRRDIVLIFDADVIDAYKQAVVNKDSNRLLSYQHSLKNLIKMAMIAYDPDGNKGRAFEIYIDSRATDL